ncbi:MAG: HTTM domain-containing protein [Candidatus Binatia bacterium]
MRAAAAGLKMSVTLPENRSLAERWRRFWFRERPLLDLAIARMLVAAFLLYLNAGGRFLRVAMVAPEHWAPLPLLELLGIEQPGSSQLAWLDVATRTALVTACFGLLTNVSLFVVFVLQLLQEAYLNSLGKVTHATLPILYALLFLACSPCGRVLSIDAVVRRWNARRRGAAGPPNHGVSLHAGWPFDLLFIEMAAFYFQAGFAKMHASGLQWADGYSLQFYLLHKGEPAGMWLAGHLWLCSALSAAVLALELGFPLAIFLRRLRPVFLIGGFAFHVGTSVFMGITFWPVWALYLLFVPWSSLLDRFPGRRADSVNATS